MSIKIVGIATLIVRDKHGRIKYYLRKRNVITYVGLAQVASLIGGLGASPFTYLAIGDGNPTNPGQCTAPSATDTALGHEIFRKPADSITQKTINVTNDCVEYYAKFSSADGLSGRAWICETGLFDSYSGGNMLARLTYTQTAFVDFTTGDYVEVYWDILIL